MESPMPAISENRDSIFQQLESSEQAAARLIDGISQVQANWHPTGARSWSISQCLDHLARTNRVYCQPMLEAIAHQTTKMQGTSTITPGWFARWFIAKMEPSARTRYKTVKKVTPGTEGDAHSALRDFVEFHSEARRVIASWDQVDFNRVRFQNPFVPILRFTVGAGLMIINAHDRRHLRQAERVQESEGYPAI
jgi:hypothetical protein